MRYLITTLALLFTSIGSVAEAPAQRLVSLNLCVDQMLLRFAPRERIASVTYFADNPLMSPLAGQAAGLHKNHGLVEEVIPLGPDLVLAGEYGAREAAELLQALGFSLQRIPLPYALDDIEGHLDRMAVILGNPPALLEHKARWQARKTRLQAAAAALPESEKPTALMLGPNHVAPGAGTLEHEMLTLAGFRNWAALAGKQGFASISLERLVIDPPDVLIVDRVAAGHFSLAHEVLSHPALDAALAQGRLASLPGNLSVCPAPNINELITVLVDLRQSLAARERP
ncbi:ABC transporter substrate-binding protein [Simiduia agarivorans]|uniref:Periplasmic binding protein n=1 Tax=Simiduia agarivorans (strain DSM 21679 / JCM 13881 / BCRC 17597 / SA1) TaxID=1117647 RepID=K4KP60_SIMAS|nr:ABC transporter substrate-binding protein [Simiduia agarivorans]AFV00026.1 periplasmic binding protein [Simiduia agarivorans SA1 = DSM 21679]